MASIVLSGILLDPNSGLAVGDQVRLTHESTTGQTLPSAQSLITIDPTGSYYIELQYGLVLVEYKDARKQQFKNLGVVTVNADNTATTLPALLNAVVPPTNPQLLQFQAILADAEAAKDLAEAAAVQITTVQLISSAATYGAQQVVTTSGYGSSGDGGSGQWKQTGVTGQAPSQSPIQLGDALLNDGNGNQWGIVVLGSINIRSLGDLSIDCGAISQIAINSGIAKKYILSGNCPFTTICDITTSDIEVDATGAYIDASGLFGSDVKNNPDPVFHIKGSQFGSATLSANAGAYDTSITVSSGTQIKVGEPIYIKSLSELWYTETGNQIFKQMVNIVKDVTGNVVKLLLPLDFDFDVSSNTVTVESWDTVKNVTINAGVAYGGNYRRDLLNGVGIGFVYAEYFTNLSVKAKLINGFENTAIRAEKGVGLDSYVDKIIGHKADYLPTIVEDVNSGFYGVFAVSVIDFYMGASAGFRCRHLQDASNGTKGIVNNARAYDCHRPGLGCHSGTYSISYHGCAVIGGRGGLQWRGFDLFIDGINIRCEDHSSSGVYDAIGGGSDIPAKRIIKNPIILAARNGIKISGNVGLLEVSGGSVYGGIEDDYHAIDLPTNNLKTAKISTDLNSKLGQYNIYFSSSASSELALIDINSSTFSGATKSHIRVNSPAGVAGIRVRGCTFEVGKTFDVNINNTPSWGVINDNYKGDGSAATSFGI